MAKFLQLALWNANGLTQHTEEWLNSKPHWATRQQTIAKTPAKWSAYQIPTVIVVFVNLDFKV
jgi:hypothetical protein